MGLRPGDALYVYAFGSGREELLLIGRFTIAAKSELLPNGPDREAVLDPVEARSVLGDEVYGVPLYEADWYVVPRAGSATQMSFDRAVPLDPPLLFGKPTETARQLFIDADGKINRQAIRSVSRLRSNTVSVFEHSYRRVAGWSGRVARVRIEGVSRSCQDRLVGRDFASDVNPGMRLISWNVNGRYGAALPKQIAALLAESPDVVALQEIRDESVRAWRDGLERAGFAHVLDSSDLIDVPSLSGRAYRRIYFNLVASHWPLQRHPSLNWSSPSATSLRRSAATGLSSRSTTPPSAGIDARAHQGRHVRGPVRQS